jgi:hypothetical protein
MGIRQPMLTANQSKIYLASFYDESVIGLNREQKWLSLLMNWREEEGTIFQFNSLNCKKRTKSIA